MNPSDVIESYVVDVLRRLPHRQRRDVGLELRSLLGEELEAKAREAGRPADEAMALEPPQQGIERAFLDRHALGGQGLAQRVAVLQLAQLREHRHHHDAAAKLLFELVEGLGPDLYHVKSVTMRYMIHRITQ